jgi:hypothetical protein
MMRFELSAFSADFLGALGDEKLINAELAE